MRRRQLLTSTQSVRRQASQLTTEKTRVAYLVTPYRDKTRIVVVQFSDPRLGSRGTTVRARISAGLPGLETASPSLDIGTPVTVVIRRGVVTVVGF